jgi:hypothetical protein
MENFREKRLERQLKSQQTTSIIIAVLLLLSIIGIVFLFIRNGNIRDENEELRTEINRHITDRQAAEEANVQLKADIQRLNAQLDEIRESALGLEAEIRTRDARIATLRRQTGEEIVELREQVAELETLRKEYEELEKERKGLLTKLEALNDELTRLKAQHEDLVTKVDGLRYLRAYNIWVHNHRDRWLGRPVTMERASRVNRTTVSFAISSNIFVDTGQKEVYLVITDPDGDVVNASQETFTINDTGDSSRYTEYTSVQYDHLPIPLNFSIIHEDRLESGTYTVEVYIDGLKAGMTEFTLG